MSSMYAQAPFFEGRAKIMATEERYSTIEDKIPAGRVETVCKNNPDHELVVYREMLVERGAKARAAYKAIIDDLMTVEKALLIVDAMPRA